MIKYILAHNICMPSAMLLRDCIEEITGIKIIVTKDCDRIKKGFPIVRYGNSSGTFVKETLLNSPNFISVCSNKLSTSKFFQKEVESNEELNKLFSFPIFNRCVGNAPKEFPVVIRSTLTGSRGVGISVVNTQEEFDKLSTAMSYWTPYVNMKEYRVHYANGNVLKIFKKEYDGETPEKQFPIRNLHNGYHFSIREDGGKFGKLKEFIEYFGKLFGQAFCAIDIGWDLDKKKYFVIELNSAPGLNENTAKLYAESIVSTLRSGDECPL